MNPFMNETESTATPNWGPTAIDKEAADIINQISNEFKPTEVSDEIDTSSVSNETASNKEGGDGAGAKTESAQPKPELTFEQKLDRELELRKREETLKAREEALANQKPVGDEIRELFSTSAAKALERLGYDPDQIVRRVIAERMGDKAPEKLRKEIEDSDRDGKYMRRIEEIERKLADKERELQARAYYDHVSTSAKDFIGKGLNEYALLAQLARTNPDRVHREIMDEITRDAQTRIKDNPNGDILPFEEAAKRVETRWGEYKSLLGGSNPAPAPITSTKTENREESKPNTQTPAIKPPERPLAPWLQQKPIEEEGVKAGLAEYYRLMKEGEKR